MIDVEGRLETGGLSAFGGTRGAGGHHRPHGLIRRALAAPVAQTRRASDEAAVDHRRQCRRPEQARDDEAVGQAPQRLHGRGDAGYQPGEKVVVKLNLNCSSRRPSFPSTCIQKSWTFLKSGTSSK